MDVCWQQRMEGNNSACLVLAAIAMEMVKMDELDERARCVRVTYKNYVNHKAVKANRGVNHIPEDSGNHSLIGALM